MCQDDAEDQTVRSRQEVEHGQHTSRVAQRQRQRSAEHAPHRRMSSIISLVAP